MGEARYTPLIQAAVHVLYAWHEMDPPPLIVPDSYHQLHTAVNELEAALEQVSGRGDGHAKGARFSTEPESSDSGAPAHARQRSPRPETVVAPCRCGHAPGRHWPGAQNKPCVATGEDGEYLTVCMCSNYEVAR